MKPYDVAVFGATGFTGRLVVDALLARHGRDVRIALAGRNRGKLEQLRGELRARHPAAREPGVMIADSADPRALGELVAAASTICTTTGPYALYGEPLLELCAESGTSYCDLSGEIPFMRASIDRYHERARATGARLVHASGFDSVPSDVAVFMLHEHFRARGKQLAAVTAYLTLNAFGVSGGTLVAMLGFLRDIARSEGARALALDPYALVPGRARRGPDTLDPVGVHYDRRIQEWTGPFIMAPVNTRIVRRTNALLGDAYGSDFRYREFCAFGRGPRAIAQALAASAQLIGLVGLGAFAPGRSLIERVGPAPGEGPSEAQRAASRFELRAVGEGEGLTAEAVVSGGDPGYGETAKMMAEIAVALACDGPRLPNRHGVLTPVAALEGRLVERLRDAGLGLEVRAA